jgi:hypothetical protein
MIHSPLTAFYDKTPDGEGHWSMTRVTAFLFALCYLVAMETCAFRAKEVNWPFAALGVFILLAVPIQALLSFLGNWIASREGRELLTTAVHKVEETMLGGASGAAAQTVKAAVTMSTETKEKG